LGHYEDALKVLYDKDPGTFSTITLVNGNFVSHHRTNRDDFLLFERLASGYQFHVGLIGDVTLREAVVGRFGASLHNPGLARQLLVHSANPAGASDGRSTRSETTLEGSRHPE
jgi:hypothetical protein